MRLNVGCGADTWGDVRLDLSKNSWMARGKSSLNMIADACYLPFKDKCFDELRIHEVLEHIRDWKKALLECCRVSKRISVSVPVDSYMPKQYIRWLLPTLTHPKVLLNLTKSVYLKYVLGLRLRTRDHLWQFNVNTLIRTMRETGVDYLGLVKVSGRAFIFDTVRCLFRIFTVAGRKRK